MWRSLSFACAVTLVGSFCTLGIAQQAGESEIVPSPEAFIDPETQSDTERLARSGLIDASELARLRDMTLGSLLSEARALIDAEDLRGAAPIVAVARERDPKNFEVTVMLGELALLNGEIQPAREKLLEAYQANRNDFRATVALGRLYLATRRHRQAVNYLEKAVEFAPQDQISKTQRLLAEGYFGANRLVKARTAAEEAVNRDSDNYEARRILATILIQIRELDQALIQIQELERIGSSEVAAKPGDLIALQRLAEAWIVHQDALRARLAQLVVVGPDGVPTDEILPGRSLEAAEITRRMVELLIREAEAQRIARLFEIAEVSEQTLKYAPESSSHWMNHGILLLETQQFDAAANAFSKAVELDPQNTEARIRLQQIQQALGVPTDSSTETAADAAAPAAVESLQN